MSEVVECSPAIGVMLADKALQVYGWTLKVTNLCAIAPKADSNEPGQAKAYTERTSPDTFLVNVVREFQ